MAEFENTFSWSKTRDDLFQDCRRKYYYNHYGFWGGWTLAADKRTREIYILKNLKTRHMWLGEVVHCAVEEILNGLRVKPAVALNITLNNLRRRMKEDLESSKKALYRMRPKRKCGLFEHEYGFDIPESEWNQILKNAQAMVTSFVHSDLFHYLKSTDANDWLPIEEMQSFRFEETPVFLKIDFALRQGDNLVIYDWKTGKMGEIGEDIQLGCYSLYASEKWNANPGNIIVKKYNLSTGKGLEAKMDGQKIENIKDYIRNSIKNMKQALHNPESNSAREKDFPKTEDAKKCAYCNFKKICQQTTGQNRG